MKPRLIRFTYSLSLLFALATVAQAQSTAFTYQGRLDDGGYPASGIYDLRFALFAAPNAGVQQGVTFTQTATAVSNGLFTSTLDFGNQFPGADRWLEIAVRTNGGGAFSTLAPRQALTPTPYAISSAISATAATVSGSVPAAQITGTLPLAQLPAAVLTNGASVTNVNLPLNSGGNITLIGNFALSSSPSVGSFPRSVTSADVNGDGKPDLISANSSTNTLTVLTNNGSGGFVLAASPGVGNSPRSVTSADVNGDGKPDLISANYVDAQLTVLTNNGSGGFVLASSPGAGSNPSSVTSADVNGDGTPDLISANFNPNTLTVLTNNGSGGFVLSSSPGVGFTPLSVTSADVNGDGRPDLISANYGPNTLTVLTNNGSGGFVLSSSPGVGFRPFSVTSADVNGDGKPDLISANLFAGTLTVLTNNGSGGFVLSSSPTVGDSPNEVTTADVNGDGKPDLISVNAGANTLTVLLNAATFTGRFVGDASSLTALNAGSLTGAVPPSALTSVPAANLTGAVPPAVLTSVPAASLTGSVADARLSANVALLNASQTFTASNNFNSNVTINPPAGLSFGSQTRQMLNLWNAEYGIGVQGGAGYFRSGGDFYWYLGGSHSDANGNGGSGGVPLMSLKSSGRLGLGTTTPTYPLEVQSGQAVGQFTTTNNGNGAVLVLKNTTASPTYLGAINFEDNSGTPGQIAYLTNGQMAFRAGGAERMTLQAGGLYVNGTFVSSSDRNVKEDFAAVNAQEVLEKVAALPLQSWSYTNRPGVKHVGPMAQDFRAAFGLGEDDKGISTVDADGVALAAIQGLNQKLEDTRRENESLKERVEKLESLLQKLANK